MIYQSRYTALVDEMLDTHSVKVEKWRRSMSGTSWQVRIGKRVIERWIEAPYPRTRLSLSIFIHEIGHHVIGFFKYKRRCEEEYHVWQWALAEMRRRDIEPDCWVLERVERSLQYAIAKALRRGIQKVPDCLLPYSKQLVLVST